MKGEDCNLHESRSKSQKISIIDESFTDHLSFDIDKG